MAGSLSMRSLGIFGSFMGAGTVGVDEWVELNPELMDKLHCTYLSSHVLRTVVGRLVSETLRGGVDVRENIERPFGKSSSPRSASGGGDEAVNLSKAEQSALRTVFGQAVIYGLLFGMVPVTTVPEEAEAQGGGHNHAPATGTSRAAFRIPPPESGRFLGRMDRKGNVQVGWRWRHEEHLGTDVMPDKDVFVFVWNRMPPNIGIPSQFNSVVLTLLPELMREIELVESDTQATYELNHPPFVIQENPRQYRDGDDTHILELNMGNYVRNPAGGDPGRGPGGTLSADQVRMQQKDIGGELRINRSLREASLRVAPGESVRTRVDPCTGEPYVVDRTVLWQRGIYKVPTGWVPTTAFPKPALRNDLANQRADIMNRVAVTIGVPPLFVTGSGAGIGVSGTRSGTKGSQAAVGGASAAASAAQQSVAYETLRTTVSAIRDELSDLYGQAHYRLMWNREVMGMIGQLADAQRLYEAQGTDAQMVARTLELLGDSLAEQIRRRNHHQLYRMDAFAKAAAIADQASKLWRGEVLQNRVDALLNIVAGARSGTAGFPDGMSLEEVGEREKRGGEGLRPRDPGVLRDPNDRRGDLTTADEDYDEEGRKRKRKREQEAAIDPNELAETMSERRARTEAEGRPVHDSVLMHRGPPDGSAGYQRRALTEEIPSISKAMRKAREMIEARLEAERRLEGERQKLRPVSGRRGDTVVELVWLSRPVPDWALIEQMAANDELDLEVYRRMKLSHFGFDPVRDAPKDKKPFETVRELAKKPEPRAPAKPKPKPKAKAKAKEPAKKKQKT